MEVLKEENFDEVIQNNENVIIDFYADWCGPCRQFSPILENFASEQSEIKVYKVDVDESHNIASKFAIRSIPTIIYFKGGEEYRRKMGLMSINELYDFTKSNKVCVLKKNNFDWELIVDGHQIPFMVTEYNRDAVEYFTYLYQSMGYIVEIKK